MFFFDWVSICSLKYILQLFQVFGVYYIFAVEVITLCKNLLTDNMGLGKI